MDNDYKLDNPVWHSLNETHSDVCITYEGLKCYEVDYCPFGGYQDSTSIAAQIDKYAELVDNFYIVGEKPEVSPALVLKKDLVCLQMIIDRPVSFAATEAIRHLDASNSRELFDLVNFVQPGYFKSKTWTLGDYCGIFKNGKLVAVTGERMKMNTHTEVSAVVTHPDHSGKGYAKQLVAHTVNKIMKEGKRPFLHVAELNISATRLYQSLGFITRRKISFWNFALVESN